MVSGILVFIFLKRFVLGSLHLNILATLSALCQHVLLFLLSPWECLSQPTCTEHTMTSSSCYSGTAHTVLASPLNPPQEGLALFQGQTIYKASTALPHCWRCPYPVLQRQFRVPGPPFAIQLPDNASQDDNRRWLKFLSLWSPLGTRPQSGWA